ncbi:hypothetical protein SLE2022_102640 [Rubroshorea leprosula]
MGFEWMEKHEAGYRLTTLHAGRTQQREISLDGFKTKIYQCDGCCCFVVLIVLMRLKPNVINYDLPHRIEMYAYQIG